MPTLNWIGKESVVNHDKEVPFRLLKKVKVHSVGNNSQNLIIHGDNLEALKALMPYYMGKIKCIYIDPPYNTGNENWVYNDKVNSPKIKKWLGKVVGRDSEDLCRHDKWLCMMYPRLKLLKDLLTEDGVIFISIDDNELDNLMLLSKELFGNENVDLMIWEKVTSNEGKLKIVHRYRTDHEYILVLYKDKYSTRFRKIEELPDIINKTENADNDPRGDWISGNVSTREEKSNKNSEKYFELTSPTGKVWKREWKYDKDEMLRLIKDKKIYWGSNGDNVPRLKVFVNEVKPVYISSIIRNKGTAKRANVDVGEFFGERVFDNPKPVDLVKYLLKFSEYKDGIVLDSFAGSGTTGHAVLDLNKEDNGNRKFILVEMEDKVVKEVTVERIKRAIQKYDYKAGFEYCELDKPLFNEYGQIDEECSFEQLATYIYFIESNTNLDKKLINKNYIGNYNDTEYYLLFKDKGKNVLTKDFLRNINLNKNKKIIYADKCLIDENILIKNNIKFKQIPYEIKVY
ncbi:MAG: site-specific DNA-methyltransferase [Peptostreptococcales bacterium]|nr:site-specific DNA-methyltransferase [Candidatus ainarchaeum sp.]